MAEIIKVDLNDEYRTLLTDVLPYELPLWYTNYSMYKTLKKGKSIYHTVSGLSEKRKIFIPLNYSISRGGGKLRDLSIIHPFAQLKVCRFYNEYSDLIEYYCGKSNKTLRSPTKKTTKFYGKAGDSDKSQVGVETINEDRITSSSYFKYRKYSFLYSFFESYEYHKLEKKFNQMVQADISNCFPSIYTHSIGWATKNKRLAKERHKGSFDGEFDSLMQDINYRETNGIIVGPEVCRIFAEIIFQQIDLNLIAKLKEDNTLILGKDYDFRRYVDDYFIFYRNESDCKFVLKALEKCLLQYKMYLNDAKTIYSKRPFASEISLAKNSLKNEVSILFSHRFKDNQIVSLYRPGSKANKIISAIKMSLANYDVQYFSVSNYLFSAIEKGMRNYLNKLLKLDVVNEEQINWILVDLDVLFFIHAMDIRIRTTDRLARMVMYIKQLDTNLSNEQNELIDKKIFDMVSQSIKIITDSMNGIVGLETLNLIIILTILPLEYKLHEDKLKKFYKGIKDASDTQDFYFSWVTFMIYIADKDEYEEFRVDLIEDAENFILNHEDGFNSTEFFLLYFDFMSCPYIEEQRRLNFGETIKEKYQIRFNSNQKFNFILNNEFVVRWNDKNYLQHSLQKREFVFSYD